MLRKLFSSGTLIAALAVWLGLSTCAVTVVALVGMGPNSRAVILMGLGLVLVWIVLGGTLMRLFRDPIRAFVCGIRLDWRVKFVLFAVLLALLEEAVTVTITNLAPVFGVPLGAAYITASANYLDVVCLHSVVVFVPMFIAWALLLRRADFPPNHVFLLFGLNGILAEASLGAQAFAEFGLWIFVYGLMVYLPAYCVPAERGAGKPKWWHYLLAVFLPILFSIPVAIVVNLVHPVPLHFPPIPPNS